MPVLGRPHVQSRCQPSSKGIGPSGGPGGQGGGSREKPGRRAGGDGVDNALAQERARHLSPAPLVPLEVVCITREAAFGSAGRRFPVSGLRSSRTGPQGAGSAARRWAAPAEAAHLEVASWRARSVGRSSPPPRPPAVGLGCWELRSSRNGQRPPRRKPPSRPRAGRPRT